MKKESKANIQDKPRYANDDDSRAVSNFIVSEILPVSLVGREGFIKMIDYFCPDVKVPCVKTIIKNIQVCITV